ncbi:type II secretion system protein GspM [Sphingobium boeckii]|uniref:General secretion pathway protein M n=1 Tax=Sphingobium boeckii TaxID=1082345 RepID=A0A7W9AKN3_9SPHN|nr:type II secretion system protein GspM [Sphingobium boeckii]MBB5687428.1 general secretion pathway protein M [Sphingobium boeckii]
MTAAFKLWWTGLSLREQRMMLVMVALLAITILWLGIIRPVDNALSSAREHHGRAVVQNAQVAAKVEAVRDLRRTVPPALDADVATAIGQSASEVGFVLGKIEAQGRDKASLSIASARPTAFFGWLQDLERRGIFPETLRARANSDRTLNIEGVFRGRAAQ